MLPSSVSVNSGLSIVPLSALALLSVAGWSHALEIRTYGAARHDRFTGDISSAPAFNDSAWYGSRNFSGVGWIPGEASRQFALVSPQHVVFARHFYPGESTIIRFLNADGDFVDRTVTGTEFILNDASLPTDLCLMELSAPITAAEKVPHFPYLNLASDSAYTGTSLTVFGWTMKAGRGSIQSFQNSTSTAINTTRLMVFRYRKSTGNQDDAYVVGGDSGSPTFASAGGNPAIVGIHSLAGENTTYYYGYDSFIPAYVTKLDVLLAPDGYRMTPAYPPAVTLSSAMVQPVTLRQAHAGSCHFDLSNTGANDAGNARFTLHFPAGQGPDAISAPDWIAESSGPQDWVFRRANLATASTARFTARWSAIPSVASVLVEVTRVADGAPSAMQTFEIEPVPSFLSWSAGLADPTEAGDPDEDGVPNLLEYAFGGEGGVPSLRSESGGLLLPEIAMSGEGAVLRFPVRADAATRGLAYSIEFSETLEAVDWQPAAFPVEDTTAPLDPPTDGFLLRTISWDRAAPRQFARVKVTLAE